MKKFSSYTSHDAIDINLNRMKHTAYFNIDTFESLEDNLKLFSEVINYLQKEDIKWVLVNNNNYYTLPKNTVYIKNMNNLSIHIEDFEKFYLENITEIVKYKNIYVNTNNDEWTTVIDKKKEKKYKLKELKEKINIMNDNWNNL